MNQVERLQYLWIIIGALVFETILLVPTLPAEEREEQIRVRLPAYTHVGCEVDGRRLLPSHPDEGEVATYWLPRKRNECLARIKRGIAGCEMATSFLSWNQNQKYPGCLDIFAREVEPCQAHYESQKAACEQGSHLAGGPPSDVGSGHGGSGRMSDVQLDDERERLALEEERERLALEEERERLALEEERERLALEEQQRLEDDRQRQLELARQHRRQQERRRLAEQQRERERQLELARQHRRQQELQEEANHETMEALFNTAIGVMGGIIQQKNQRRRDRESAPTPTYSQPTFTPLPSPGSSQSGSGRGGITRCRTPTGAMRFNQSPNG